MRTEAARTAGIGPDRILFAVTFRTACDYAIPGFFRVRSQAIRDVLDDLLPERQDRECQRAKEPPKNTFRPNASGRVRHQGRIQHQSNPESHVTGGNV
jgi:hypothetical protein